MEEFTTRHDFGFSSETSTALSVCIVTGFIDDIYYNNIDCILPSAAECEGVKTEEKDYVHHANPMDTPAIII